MIAPPSLRRRCGFTLFEVAISLVIVSVGVLSVLMLMPIGIKAQQLARYQTIASAKAVEIISVNANQWRKWDEQRLEGQNLGLCSINQVAQSPLVEQKMCNWRHGSLPVPMEIARRLDSDGDEIQRILAEGGYLFYSSPRPIASTGEDNPLLEDREIPNESQRLVYAVVGHAQQPALASHPCKAWPYYDWYPAPPRARVVLDTSSPNSRHEDSWRLNNWPALTQFIAVADAWKAVAPPVASPAKADIVAYRDKAKELVIALGMTVDGNGIPTAPPGSAYTPVDAWKVLAAGYVAQSMVWLTSTANAPTAGDLTAAQIAHESALTWLRRHVTTNPYDWGIDRPLNFQNGWDHPLLQYEMFASDTPTAGLASLFTVPTNGDVSWKILSGQPVINAGTSSSYGVTSLMAGPPAPGVPPRPNGNKQEISDSWGGQSPGVPDTFNLTNPFQPADRCREIVFWAVDWKSYADFESAPSAPQDASRFPYDSDGRNVYNGGAHKFHNPERWFTFGNATRTSTAESISNKHIYLGMYGADRNGNKQFDVGPVPTSVRMRAINVARFNFYQPRVWAGLRN
jgi:prepilin-type N-terminal cleavage/methylation domain-containing protein